MRPALPPGGLKRLEQIQALAYRLNDTDSQMTRPFT